MTGYRGLFVATTLLIVTFQRAFSQSPQEFGVTLRSTIAQSCELLQKGQLEIYEGYAFLRIDGGEVYSPELGKQDVVEYPAGTSRQAVKRAEKSGFRMKPMSSAKGNDVPKVVGAGNSPNCPTIENAFEAAAHGRAGRRHQVQSKTYKAGIGGVSPPQAIDTPSPQASEAEASSPKTTGNGGHGATETILVSAVVAADGGAQQIKVLSHAVPRSRQASGGSIPLEIQTGKKKWAACPSADHCRSRHSL